MANLLWENKIIVCDICKQYEVKSTIEVSKRIWKGVCEHCLLTLQGDKMKKY